MKENFFSNIKVVVMVPSPLSPRWMSNFCIDALANQYDVEYWDCSAICEIKFEANEIVERPYVYIINSLNDLENNLKRLPCDAVMISHIHHEAKGNYNVHKLIAKYNKYRVFFNFWGNMISASLNLIPNNNVTENNVAIIQRKHTDLYRKIKRFLYSIRPILYFKEFLKTQGDYRYKNFVSVDKQLRTSRKNIALYDYQFVVDVLPHKEFSINHPDYEKYLTINRSQETALVKDDYVVFLDSGFPFHPHLKTENPEVDFDALAPEYFSSLNSFFDRIEQQYKYEVVIAAHPSAKNLKKNPFGKRKVFYNKSAELVKNSKAVCMHASYSIAFAVLFNKPICLMSNAAIRRSSNMITTLDTYSKVFHLPIVDIDGHNEMEHIFQPLLPEIRDGYINLFFDTTNTKLNTELIPDYIKKIHNQIVEMQKI